MTTSRRLLGLAVWVLLAGGLLAMHGLGTHGTRAHAAVGQPAIGQALTHVDGQKSAADHAQADPEATSGTERSAIGTPIGHGSMTGLFAACLAILCGILAAVAAVFLRQLSRRPLACSAREVRALVIAGRDRDPPCLVRLSVMRC